MARRNAKATIEIERMVDNRRIRYFTLFDLYAQMLRNEEAEVIDEQ